MLCLSFSILIHLSIDLGVTLSYRAIPSFGLHYQLMSAIPSFGLHSQLQSNTVHERPDPRIGGYEPTTRIHQTCLKTEENQNHGSFLT